jgi:hypothetical protein
VTVPDFSFPHEDLLARIKENLPELEALLADSSSHWGYEDRIYRFYHHSFKVYSLQGSTSAIVEKLQALAPECPLDEYFMQIVREGTGKTWKEEDNERWLEVTRPIVEAYFHARYFLEMAVKYGKALDEAPGMLPSGWAALLTLYGMR